MIQTAWKSLTVAVAVFVMSAAASAAPQATPVPTPTPSAAPTNNPSINYLAHVPEWVWVMATLAAFALVAFVLYKIVSRPRIAVVDLRPPTDKDLESLRIFYGFWLINGALAMVLAVAILAVLYKASGNVSASDVLALVTSVTAVVGTLIASFFGVQAAGAGRSQAMDKLQSQSQSPTTYKLTPAEGLAAGGYPVSINGNGFTGATHVNFGTTSVGPLKPDNDGLITATAPAGTAGQTVELFVVFPNSTPPNISVGHFKYT